MSAVTLLQAAVVCLPAVTLLTVLWWLERDPAPPMPRMDQEAVPGPSRAAVTPVGTSQAPSDRRPRRAA